MCEANKGLGGGHGIYPSFCTSPAPRTSGVHPTWVRLSPDACSCVLLCKVPAIKPQLIVLSKAMRLEVINSCCRNIPLNAFRLTNFLRLPSMIGLYIEQGCYDYRRSSRPTVLLLRLHLSFAPWPASCSFCMARMTLLSLWIPAGRSSSSSQEKHSLTLSLRPTSSASP